MKHTVSTVILCLSTALVTGADQTPGQTQSSWSSTNRLDGTNAQSSAAAAGREASQEQLKVTQNELNTRVTDVNKASKFMGMKVKNKQDEDLGSIRDLVIDHRSGKIAYAVLAHGAILGIGGKNVAVPIQALTLQPGEKALLLDLPKEQVAQAPGFNDERWPDLNAAAKGQTIGLAHTPAQSAEDAQGGSTQTGESDTTGRSQSPDWNDPAYQPGGDVTRTNPPTIRATTNSNSSASGATSGDDSSDRSGSEDEQPESNPSREQQQ